MTIGLRLEELPVDHKLSGAFFDSYGFSLCALAWPNGFRACVCIAAGNCGEKAERPFSRRSVASPRTRAGLHDRADARSIQLVRRGASAASALFDQPRRPGDLSWARATH